MFDRTSNHSNNTNNNNNNSSSKKMMTISRNRSLRNFFPSSSEKDGKEKAAVVSNNNSNNNNNRYHKLNDNLILKLAGKKRFDKLASVLLSEYYESAWHASIPEELNILQKKDTDETSRVSDSSVEDDMNNSTTLHVPITAPLLHQVLEHRPPFAVVDLICSILEQENQAAAAAAAQQQQQQQHKSHTSRGRRRRILPPSRRSSCSCCSCASPEDMVDIKGHKPLHIAVIQCCEIPVIQRLLEGSYQSQSNRVIVNLGPPRPACSKDYLGRTPLHWACANPQGQFGKKNKLNNKKKKSNLLDFFKDSKKELKESVERQCKVVELLLQDSPKVIDFKDRNGQTPLDLAYQKDADPEIFRLLIQAARTLHTTENHHSKYNTTTTNSNNSGCHKLLQKEETHEPAVTRFGDATPKLDRKYKSTRQLNSGFHERRKNMVNYQTTTTTTTTTTTARAMTTDLPANTNDNWNVSFHSLDAANTHQNFQHEQPPPTTTTPNLFSSIHHTPPRTTGNLKRAKFVQFQEDNDIDDDEEAAAAAVDDLQSDVVPILDKVKSRRSWNPLDLIVECGNHDYQRQQEAGQTSMEEMEDDISSIGSEGASVYYAMSRKIEDQIFRSL